MIICLRCRNSRLPSSLLLQVSVSSGQPQSKGNNYKVPETRIQTFKVRRHSKLHDGVLNSQSLPTTNYHCSGYPYSVCLLPCWHCIVYVQLALTVLNNSQTGKRNGHGSLNTPKSCHKELTGSDHIKKII